MSGTQGQALGGAATDAAQSYQFPMQGSGGMAQPMGVNLNPNVQRQPGGFGISPQLLQMIAALQSRSPQFRPQAPQPTFTPGQSNGQIVNPYQTIDGRGSR